MEIEVKWKKRQRKRPVSLCLVTMALIVLVMAGLALMSPASAASGSLADIEHVVLFMQENRAFDHYFGTMAGVRGFSDPNVHMVNNRSIFYQAVSDSVSRDADYLLPFYLNYQGGTWPQATQCMVAGDNGWKANHAALNGDQNDQWVNQNTAWSWGYFKRSDLPVHFAIAEGWTVGDMYQESVITSTNPNRVSWISGSINAPGSPQDPSAGTYIDNHETPGCESTNLNCWPITWKTAPEIYEAAGVTWQVYQDKDNFDDNPLAWFKQVQDASKDSPLTKRGNSFLGLDKFYSDAAAGTLPQISYIIGPMELSEHPPYQPRDGAWLQKQIVQAVANSPAYKSTVLMISFDETGGFGDHVVPFHSPSGTSGEWMNDPYGNSGSVYTGPGFRLPFYIISPWTRGGNVFAENADHVSQLKFVEQWLLAKGVNVTTDQIPAWRRTHMSDLTKAFDFANPDYSLPSIPDISAPSKSGSSYNGWSQCEQKYPTQRPDVPYGNQTPEDSLFSEQGFKPVRGYLTEGRYLVFEMNGNALTNAGTSIGGSPTTAKHDSKKQRWVVHQQGSPQQGSLSASFQVTSAVDGSYLAADGKLVSDSGSAGTFTISDLGNGKGYTIKGGSGYLTIASDGSVSWSSQATGFALFSVTYNN